MAIAWLANPPMNAISPQVIQDLGKVWEEVKADDELKAMVVYSSLPVVFSAGADIKAFTGMDEAGGAELINTGHALLRELGQNRKSTVAAVNAIAFGGGCELAMACDFRIVGPLRRLRPARDQPGDHPRLRRHPAAARAWWGPPRRSR